MTGEPEPEEEVHGALVEVEPAPLAETRSLSPMAVQTAAVAGAGFLAGATAIAVLRGRRSGALRLGGRRRKGRLDVVGTRTFLVDVHLVDRR